MGFPVLGVVIRSSGQPQWRIAQLAGISESRLSRIIRRGEVTADERVRLSQLLGLPQDELFAKGPAVSLNVTPQLVG